MNVFWTTRLPRIISAFLFDAALSVSDAVFKYLFKNSLDSPYYSSSRKT
ncbi:iron chelate uptake ABC transporter family permease subunit [Microaceticoccus formicicus]